MIFDILTIFPEAFESYFNTSILKRAQKKGLVKIRIHNLRKWTNDRYQTVDDRPYGGGAGMILKIEPIYRALKDLKKERIKSYVILFSAGGKLFNQNLAKKLAKKKRLILICGHYEGTDERIAKYLADEEISIGRYVLTGGEIPAMVLVDSISRLIPGVIKEESLKEESFTLTPNQNIRNIKNLKLKTRPEQFGPEQFGPEQFGPEQFGPEQFGPELTAEGLTAEGLTAEGLTAEGRSRRIKNLLYCEYPQYTRPAVFKIGRKEYKVPKVLLSGNHKAVETWRKKHRRLLKD